MKKLLLTLLTLFFPMGSVQSMNDAAKKDLAWFKSCLDNQELVATLKNIKLVVSDVDGALTNATIYVTEEQEEGRFFSIQDGYAFKPALQTGLLIAMMSGKAHASTVRRGMDLGLPQDMCIVGSKDKVQAITKLQQEKNVSIEQTLMFGDDFLDADVKVRGAVKLFACPNNTPFYFQNIADIVIPKDGGTQAFRLLLDLILYVQGKHFAQDIIKAAVGEK